MAGLDVAEISLLLLLEFEFRLLRFYIKTESLFAKRKSTGSWHSINFFGSCSVSSVKDVFI